MISNLKIRYAEISANNIFNWLAPRNVTLWTAFPHWRESWWSDDTLSLRHKGEEIWIAEFDALTKHYSQLEESILKEGVKHPIKVIAGAPFDKLMASQFPIDVIPPEQRTNKVLSTHQFGGSRVYIAQKHNLSIPCLIYDFSNAFSDFDTINIETVAKQFSNFYKIHTYANGIKTLTIHKHMHMKEGTPTVPRNTQLAALNAVKVQLGLK